MQSVKHIPIQSAKLHRIAAVNQLSREIAEGKYTLEEAVKCLEQIKIMPGKRTITKMLAAGTGSGGFCYLLGGHLTDMLAAFLSGFLLYTIFFLVEKREKTTSRDCCKPDQDFLFPCFL